MVYPSKDLVTTTVGRAAFILCLVSTVNSALVHERDMTEIPSFLNRNESFAFYSSPTKS